jgi:meso-butanediol dehydrogenase/(S,S)-butanediol dehydrogenase/diacetyl reductase
VPYAGLTGKAAIVTGGARGMGAATVRRLCDEGCRVVAVDILPVDEREVADADNVLNVVADVSTEAGCEGYVAAAVERFGSVDYLVNNAGITGIAQPITEVPIDDFDKVFGVNTRAVFLGMRFFLLQLYRQETPGAIVNVSSMAAMKSFATRAIYGASKRAVIGFSNVAAIENGPRGIRVNTVLPGSVQTPMSAIVDKRRASMGAAADFTANPIPRRADPAEAAAFITYLLSDDASFLTGGVYTLDGGLSVR